MGYVNDIRKVVPATEEALREFSRDHLREYAKSLGITPGKTKDETIFLLLASGKAQVVASLGGVI